MQKQNGNVLFLILIAIALFAALSYAVVSSTRSGKDASNETSLIDSASLTALPNDVRLAVMRMRINGIAFEDLEFNPPSDFDNCSSPSVCVFHPEGGGATYMTASPDLYEQGSGGWTFNYYHEIQDIGETVNSGFNSDGHDLVAYLIGVKESVCRKVNQKEGLGSTIPTAPIIMALGMSITDYYDNTKTMSNNAIVFGNSGDTAIFAGHSEGCFKYLLSPTATKPVAASFTNPYIYYHVIGER